MIEPSSHSDAASPHCRGSATGPSRRGRREGGPVHTRDGELHGLVLRGALRMGIADSAGALRVREHPARSFVTDSSPTPQRCTPRHDR